MLIAEPRETQRTLLCAIYSASRIVTHVEVVTNCTELLDQLENRPADFYVVHQSLITDIALLPEGHFVIVASELDNDMLTAAYSHDTRGYFLDNPLPAAQLLAALDPTGASWLPEYVVQTALLVFRHGSNELDTLLLVLHKHCQARSALFEPCLKLVYPIPI